MIFLSVMFALPLALALRVALGALCRKVRRFDAARSRWLRLEVRRLRRGEDAEWRFRLYPFWALRACFWRWDVRKMLLPSTAKTRLQADVISLGAALSNLLREHNGLARHVDGIAALVGAAADRVEQVLDHDERLHETLAAVLRLRHEKTGAAGCLPYRASRPDSFPND